MSSSTANREGYDSFVKRIRQEGLARFPAGYDRIVFTNGCFDVLHRGHVEVLRHARELAGPTGAVVVGLNSDRSVRKLKGEGRPIIEEDDRAFLLCNLRVVDYVIIFEEDTPMALIASLRPHVIVKGGDYRADQVIGHNQAMISICPYVEGRSTTEIERKIRG